MSDPTLTPLLQMANGTSATIAEIKSGRALVARLAGLGIYHGAQIEMIQGSLHGATIISHKGNRIVIGLGVADKILVRLKEQKS